MHQRMCFGVPANGLLQCIQNVGTLGVAWPAVGVDELCADMMTAAQGGTVDATGP